jgi:tRNA (cytidine/uridine-2'-O-)-methyltransferase
VSDPLLHIVLLNPEIPNNTGNIGRTAAATGCRLHIVNPIAFDMSEKARRRAGLDYWHLVDCVEHPSWEKFLEREGLAVPSCQKPSPCPLPGGEGSRPKRLWLYTTKSTRPHWHATFRRGDYLLFGKETAGVPEEIHDWVAATFGDHHRITLPMIDVPAARSLNLATAVCAAVYEAMRQIAVRD